MKDKKRYRDIVIPKTYNYIAVFLTFSCNYKCSYCINDFGKRNLLKKMIPGERWAEGLNRIVSRDDLPITLQGGEPSLHKDFLYIINHIKRELHVDILTNLQFDVEKFIAEVSPDRINRKAPYAPLRVSYHPEVMNLEEVIKKTLRLLEAGFSVGVYGILHPLQEKHIKEAQKKCLDYGIDFRTKEFLGEYNGRIYGTYKYPGACSRKFRKKVLCKATELLVDSQGDIFRCHHDLYKGVNSIDTLFNPDFEIKDIYRDCDYFGSCNPCDVKLKTNRFQEYGHTSVDIKFDIMVK